MKLASLRFLITIIDAVRSNGLPSSPHEVLSSGQRRQLSDHLPVRLCRRDKSAQLTVSWWVRCTIPVGYAYLATHKWDS